MLTCETPKRKRLMRILITFFCLISISCSPFQVFNKYSYRQDKASHIKTVIITPIDMIRSNPKGTDYKKAKNLETAIEDYVRASGYSVMSNALLANKWRTEAQMAGGFFNPMSGEIDGVKISTCLMKAIGKTKEEEAFDGVVFAQLVERPAILMGDRVYWDGCSRKILDDNNDVVTGISWSGEMKAISLQIQVFDKNHQLIFQNIGPIEFPFELMSSYNSKEFVWKDTLQFNTDETKEGIGIAFYPFIGNVNYPKNPKFYEDQ